MLVHLSPGLASALNTGLSTMYGDQHSLGSHTPKQQNIEEDGQRAAPPSAVAGNLQGYNMASFMSLPFSQHSALSQQSGGWPSLNPAALGYPKIQHQHPVAQLSSTALPATQQPVGASLAAQVCYYIIQQRDLHEKYLPFWYVDIIPLGIIFYCISFVLKYILITK